MKTTTTFKTNFIYAVALLHIILFTYAAVSKLLDFQNFRAQLGQSPLLTIFADYIAYMVPSLELIIALFLMIPKYRISAIYASCFLMFLFTVYIVMILNFTSFVPCSCGGVLEKLGWEEHLIFNLVFVLLAIVAIALQMGFRHTAIISLIGGSIGVAFMIMLFLLSEDVMHNENPFIRRFPQGAAAEVAELDLRNTNFYIAGATEQYIYLGNRKAQLQITVIDTKLKNRRQFAIKLDQPDFKFRNVTIKVQYPHFYVYDGSVPVIYKGLVSDWRASIISYKQYGFNDIQFINNHQDIIVAGKPRIRKNFLALVNHKDSIKVKFNEDLLQAQIDGFFDTGGTLQYSFGQKKIVYTYYYRNEYIVTDSTLSLIHRGNTIDTIKKAKLKIVPLKSGDRELGAPPLTVNKLTAIKENLLFVNSMLRGRFENEKVWKSATAVDVYDFTTQTYLLSFYVHDESGFRMNDFYATNDALYILSGHYLIKYGLGHRITSKFKK